MTRTFRCGSVRNNFYCDGCCKTAMHYWTGEHWRCGSPGCYHRKLQIPVQKGLDIRKPGCTLKT